MERGEGGGNQTMSDFDKEMKKVNAWAKKSGVDQMQDEEIVVIGIERKTEDTITVNALVNIYMKNGEFYSRGIEFEAKKRKRG
jgi:hypothetical protein